MRIILSPTEWHEKFISFSQDQFNSPDKVDLCTDSVLTNQTPEDDYGDRKYIKKILKSFAAQYKMRIIQMRPLFVGQPQFEKICKDRSNYFVDSCCRTYIFDFKKSNRCEYMDEYHNGDVNELRQKVIDLKYIINLCGYYLTDINLESYPFSGIMPFINDNCPNVETLRLAFKEFKSQDFKNVFCNMSHLNILFIEWQCEYSPLPISLIESLEKVGGTLEYFYLQCNNRTDVSILPHSLASVILGFVVLKKFSLFGFEPNQPLLESIGQMQNLVDISFLLFRKKHQIHNDKINMYPIGNLKNLEKLSIDFDYGVTNEFVINLCNNAKKLNFLSIFTTHVTDDGMNALDNLDESVLFIPRKP